jgi:2-methylfumaryl-CoA hydratase
VAAADLSLPESLDFSRFDFQAAGSPHRWGDYEAGEKIDHGDAMTIEEAEHQMATRLYQNTARVHFNQHAESQGRFGKRIVYGGHVISLARALSFNGLGTAVKLAAINSGTHAAPSFAGDTIYAWSQVLERIEIPGRRDVGALRLRTVAAKNLECCGFPDEAVSEESAGRYHPAVVLDLDYTVLLPR